MIDTGYTKILCSDGKVISVGGRQRDFLAEAGIIAPLDAHGSFKAPEHSLPEINAITMSERSLQDCDLCHFERATHKQECRAFELLIGPNAGGQLGGPFRPVLLCAECARRVRQGRRPPLLDHLLDSYVERARDAGILRPGVTKRAARDAMTPALRDVVGGLLNNVIGEPEEL